MEQIRAPQATPECPSAELGIGEKRRLRKGVKSAFKGSGRIIRLGIPRRIIPRRLVYPDIHNTCEAATELDLTLKRDNSQTRTFNLINGG